MRTTYRKRILPLLGLVSLSLAASFLAPGQDASRQREVTSPSPNAIPFLKVKARAETGDAIAQAELGRMYEHGQGVPQDYAEAAKWHQKAAGQGLPSAEYRLAECYRHGRGVPQDYVEAAKWYRNAAEQGVASAQFNLGMCYYNAHGVPQDFDEGLKWYRKAADQGLALAQYNLGLRYGSGMGAPQDYAEAYKWFNLATTQKATHAIGDRNDISDSIPSPSPAYLSLTLQMRNEILGAMTQSQIAEGRRLCREFAARQEGGASKQAGSPMLAGSSQSHF
jgi:hypothetical protein